MDREFLFRSRWYPAGHSVVSGVYSGFFSWTLAATMQCTAGLVLRRRHSGSTWTVLQVIFQLGALWLCTSENVLSSCGRRPVMTQCFADSACCDRIVLPSTWYGIHVYPVMNLWVADFDWSPTLPYVTLLALPRSCSRKGAVQLQFGSQQCTLLAPEPTVLYTANTVRLELNTWARTCERTLRG